MRGDSCGNEESGKAAASECDVGLGLNMQYAESSKKMNFMSHPSPYHHHQHRACTEIGGGNGSSGRLLLDNSTATSNQIASATSFKYATGGETGKVFFTASQWQEFESQAMIYKYIMASIPVPPQLLLPLSTQSNRSGTDLRFPSGSDPEPWRCRRTDGKKWRCSRDVVPDQKYCERHAHKNRPRSRKPVETQSHNTKTNVNIATNPLSCKDNYHPILPPAPSMPTSCQQSRCTERLMKSDTIPLSSSNKKIQKPMHSPSVGSKRDHFYQQHLEGNHQDESHLNFLNNTSSVAAAASARTQQLTGAWSRSGGDNCSLTLSMQPGRNGIYEDHDFFQMAIGMLNADRGGNADEFVSNSHNQWVNQASWLGGPLGEALCLGIASTQKGPPNVPSPHGYSSSTTSSSSCQDDGGHGLH